MFDIDPKKHKSAQKQEKIRGLTKSTNPNEADVAKKKLRPSASIDLPKVNKEEVKIVDKILQELGEEKKGLWANIHARRKKGLPKKKPGQKGYPETLNIKEGLKQARKNVGASKCWDGKKVDPNQPTKIKGGKEVPNCVPESLTIEDADGNTFAEVIDIIKVNEESEKKYCKKCKKRESRDECKYGPKVWDKMTSDDDDDEDDDIKEAVKIPAKSGNLLMVVVMWRGKTYGLRVFFPQTKMPNKKEVEQEIQKIYPDSRVTYIQKVEREPGQPFLQVEGAAWTKKAGKSKSGGLNEKGRRSYEKENPGSDLKAPSKKVGNPRRASFCARMTGMKKKLTSSKTANDPDSRINKSLRAWNC